MNFLLPDLGEGIESGTVSRVHVKAGDSVTAEQNVLTVETDKAAMDVPIDVAGTIETVMVKPGDKVNVGAPLFKMSGNGQAPAAKAEKPEPTPSKEPATNGTATKAETPPAAPGGSVAFKLPDLGEGIESGTVSRVHVKAGDSVTAEQNVLTVETDKAAMDVPINVAGTVESVAVKPGEKLTVGATVLTIKTAAGAAPAAPPTPSKPAAETPKAAPAKPQSNGVAATVPAGVNGSSGGTKTLVAAGPATRRLARELGVLLGEVPGTARAGRVTLDDVKGFVRTRIASPAGAPAHTGGSIVNVFTHPPLPDFSKFGAVEKVPTTNIRKKIAENLTIAWRMMPMVTQNELADITDLEAGRKRIVEGLPKGTAKVTWTVLAVKAVVAVLKEFPNFNSSLDMNAGELHVKKYFNIGIAVDTERGLVVPVIKNADTKFDPRHRRGRGRARREGPHWQAAARRDARRHVHDHQPRRHRRHQLHADRQLPRSRHPGPVEIDAATRRKRRRDRPPADDAAEPDLRPPRHRRGRRLPLHHAAGAILQRPDPAADGELRRFFTLWRTTDESLAPLACRLGRWVRSADCADRPCDAAAQHHPRRRGG